MILLSSKRKLDTDVRSKHHISAFDFLFFCHCCGPSLYHRNVPNYMLIFLSYRPSTLPSSSNCKWRRPTRYALNSICYSLWEEKKWRFREWWYGKIFNLRAIFEVDSRNPKTSIRRYISYVRSWVPGYRLAITYMGSKDRIPMHHGQFLL